MIPQHLSKIFQNTNQKIFRVVLTINLEIKHLTNQSSEKNNFVFPESSISYNSESENNQDRISEECGQSGFA